jgi:hypothetical protein
MPPIWMPAKQREGPFTTGTFPVAQFDSCQKPFVAYGNAPIGDVRVAGDGPDW